MKLNPQFVRLIPLLLMLVVAIMLSMGLFNNDEPKSEHQRLIGMHTGVIDLPSMDPAKPRFASPDWLGQVVVLNVFASWCEPCVAENPAVMKLSQSGKVAVYGLAWKDTPQRVSAWLTTHGNPYHQIGVDTTGHTTVTLALSGVPETFVLGKDGTVFYHQQAPIDAEEVDTVILPLVDQLNAQEYTAPKVSPARVMPKRPVVLPPLPK